MQNSKQVNNLKFDKVNNFRNGFALVESNGKFNFIDKQGNLLTPNQWFDKANNFRNGFAKVYKNSQGWNFLNKEGEFLIPFHS